MLRDIEPVPASGSAQARLATDRIVIAMGSSSVVPILDHLGTYSTIACRIGPRRSRQLNARLSDGILPLNALRQIQKLPDMGCK
jgi:hypothetical protein